MSPLTVPSPTGSNFESPDSPEGGYTQQPVVPHELQQRFSQETKDLIGETIGATPGFAEVQHTINAPLHTPEVMTTVSPVADTFHVTPDAPPPSPTTVHVDPRAVVKGTAKAFGGFGAAGAVGGAAATLALGGSATAAALGALPVAAYAAATAGSTYLGGALHNLVWQRPDSKKPGFWGTMLRGVISPVSVPFGVGWRLMKG